VQGNLSLLNDPVAQELLHAPIPARLAYVWPDGTPRVIPIWFWWTGEELVFSSPPNSPKMKVLARETKVAVSIDTETWPAKSLTLRGTAHSQVCDGEVPEYADMVRKYLGDEAGVWLDMYSALFPHPVRIALKPEWAGIIDAENNRLPSAVMAAMAATG
jgi:hypothetical protein